MCWVNLSRAPRLNILQTISNLLSKMCMSLSKALLKSHEMEGRCLFLVVDREMPLRVPLRDHFETNNSVVK